VESLLRSDNKIAPLVSELRYRFSRKKCCA
jgi:hypothetical protein